MDLDYQPMAKAIKMDAAVRFTGPGQKLENMVKDDLDIHDEKEFNQKVEEMKRKMQNKAETCPLL